jgi:hypothetical protein
MKASAQMLLHCKQLFQASVSLVVEFLALLNFELWFDNLFKPSDYQLYRKVNSFPTHDLNSPVVLAKFFFY